jgi:lipopolysaccharide export LptBFGC system permease protein LptF
MYVCLAEAGLQGSDEKLYTYTIITTSSNSYLKFLHDRMPVILDPGSEAMKTWLDPSRTTWSRELQSALKPYEGELECYAVPKEVGKVGNNSPDFTVPVASKDNKNNIANFFANAKKKDRAEPQVNTEEAGSSEKEQKVVKDRDEQRTTQDGEWTEDNAPVPVPGVKRAHPPDGADENEEDPKKQKLTTPSPEAQKKSSPVSSRKQTRSATKGAQKNAADKSKPITAFFQK